MAPGVLGDSDPTPRDSPQQPRRPIPVGQHRCGAPALNLALVDTKLTVSLCTKVSLVLWVVGFLFEFTADIEKATFRADPANKSRFITTG